MSCFNALTTWASGQRLPATIFYNLWNFEQANFLFHNDYSKIFFCLLGAIFFSNRNKRPDGRNPNLFWRKFMVYITVFYHNNSAQMIKDGSKNIVQRSQTSDWRHLTHIILSQTIFKEKKFRKTHINQKS